MDSVSDSAAGFGLVQNAQQFMQIITKTYELEGFMSARLVKHLEMQRCKAVRNCIQTKSGQRVVWAHTRYQPSVPWSPTTAGIGVYTPGAFHGEYCSCNESKAKAKSPVVKPQAHTQAMKLPSSRNLQRCLMRLLSLAVETECAVSRSRESRVASWE